MQDLLSQLASFNIRLEVKGDQLHVNAPAGMLTDEIQRSLRKHKEELIKQLRAAVVPANEVLPELKSDIEARYEPFPLTDVQHAYWMGRNQKHIELSGVSTHFYYELVCEELDLKRLQESFNRLIRRHEMLRAVVDEDGRQRILPQIPEYRIQVFDLRKEDRLNQRSQVENLRRDMSHQVLSTARAPMMEICATKISDSETRLHFSMDMLILDGTSMMLLFREWKRLYDDPGANLPQFSISYRDYVLAEIKLKEGTAYQRAKDYWWSRIDELPPAPQLPVRRHSQSMEKPCFSRRRYRLAKHKWQKIKKRAQSLKVTQTNLLLTAFCEVLTRWSKASRYCLNLTLFNRWPFHPDVVHLLGDFTSLSILEVNYQHGYSFSQRIAAIQSQFLRDLEYREVSGVEVLREWSKRRGAMFEAAMPVVFTSGLINSPTGEDAGLWEVFGPMDFGVSQTPQVWLDHQVMEINNELVFNWDAVDSVFEPGVLDAMFGTYCEFLENLADDESLWEKNDVVPLPGQMRALRESVNATGSDRCQKLLHEGFLNQAAAKPDAVALISQSRTLSYGQLLAESMVVADWLQKARIDIGQPVAVLMHKGWEQVVAVLGILLAGGAYLPVNANLPARRQAELLEIGGVKQVITQPRVAEIPSHQAILSRYTVKIVKQPDSMLTAAEPLDAINQEPGDLAYIIFTSGTTGVPKGVMIDHRGAVNTLHHINRMFNVGPQDCLLGVSSLSFDLSVYDIFGVLDAGASLVLPEYRKEHDPVHWRELINKFNVSIWNSAPQLMRMLLDSFHGNEPENAILRTVLLSGDWIPLELPERIRNYYPHAQIISLGGATEASVWSVFYPIKQIDASWSSIPYGKPLPNQTVWVLDRQLRPCPDYVDGRIYIGGDGVAIGYWRDEEKTGARFITHPHTGERLYDTGDIGRYAADGNIIFLGRDDGQVKIRGHRIELEEIQAVLARHPDIEQALVLSAQDSNGVHHLGAYVVRDYLSVPIEFYKALTADNEYTASENHKWQQSALESYRQYRVRHSASLADFEQYWLRLKQLCVITMLQTLREITNRNAFRFSDIIGGNRVDSRHQRLLEQWTVVLEKAAYVIPTGEDLYQFNLSEIPSAEELDQALKVCEDRLDPDTRPLTEYVRDCLENQFALLAGDLEPTDLLFLEGDWARAESLYQHNPVSKLYNRVVADLLAVWRKGWPENRPFRVLEVGAGTGGATSEIMKVLAQTNTEYFYTDVTPYFLPAAHSKFAAYDFVNYGVYDINISPAAQGYKSHDFDCIIAINVLHDAKNLNHTLKHLKSLLSPGGKLLALEATLNTEIQMVTIAYLEGFGNYGDEREQENLPLLTVEQWSEYFHRAGYERFAALPSTRETVQAMQQNILVAEAPKTVFLFQPEKVRAYLADRLPEYMVPNDYMDIPAIPVTTNGKVDYASLPSFLEKEQFNQTECVSPRNEVEQILLNAWSGVMNNRDFGVTDNFYDLGGDSLVATQIVREVNILLPEFKLEMHEFFGNLTIAELADLYQRRDIFRKTQISTPQELMPDLVYDAEIIIGDVKECIDQIGAGYIDEKGRYSTNPKSIFITGATGWVGAYVMADLLALTEADIYCLVRADNEAHALKRVKDNLDYFKLVLGENRLRRIKPVIGDFSKADFGLAPEIWNELALKIDAIYHMGASVSTIASYRDMRRINLESTVAVARLALSGRLKPVFFSSSMAINIKHSVQGFTVSTEERPIDSPHGLLSGYTQSKWAAEQVLLDLIQRGLPVKIFRISHVLPATETAVRKPGYLFESVFKLAYKAGVVPDWDGRLYGMPADITSRLLVVSSLQDDGYSGVVHLETNFPRNVSDLVELSLGACGEKPQRIPITEWLERCRQVAIRLSGETLAVVGRLFTPTTSGTVFEAMFDHPRIQTSYLDSGNEKLKSILNRSKTTEEYWRAYFGQIKWG